MKQLIIALFTILLIFSCETTRENADTSPEINSIEQEFEGDQVTATPANPWQTSEFSEVPITSFEKWNIDGTIYDIPQTVITGGLLFTVHAIVNHNPLMDETNKQIARDLASYAIQNGFLGNALKYTQYDSDKFYVSNEMIGVSLIHIVDHETMDLQGVRFAFEVSELAPGLIYIPEINGPASFNTHSRKELKDQIKEIVESRNFKDIYTLISPDIIQEISEEEIEQAHVFMSLVNQYVFDEKASFTVYLGNKNGINGYNHYIPVTVIPEADHTQRLDAFFQILIIDEKPQHKIYNIMLNFSKYEIMRVLFGGEGGVEFPVLTD